MAVKHTRHGYWLEEAGRSTPAPPLAGDREADVVIVGGGFTGLWAAWHLQAAGARGAGRPARGRRALRARAERPQRRLLQRDVVLAADHARALGRRAGAGRRPRRRAGGGRDRRLLRGAGGRRLVPARRLPAGLDRRRPRPRLGRGARRLPRARRRRRGRAAERRGGRRAAAPRRSSAAAPSTRLRRRVQPARLALGLRERLRDARGRDLRVLAGALAARRRPAASRPARRAGAVRAGAAVLAIGAAAKARARPAARPPLRRLLPHRPHRAGARR